MTLIIHKSGDITLVNTVQTNKRNIKIKKNLREYISITANECQYNLKVPKKP